MIGSGERDKEKLLEKLYKEKERVKEKEGIEKRKKEEEEYVHLRKLSLVSPSLLSSSPPPPIPSYHSVSFLLLDPVDSLKHNLDRFNTYTIGVDWKGSKWEIHRRYKQFYNLDRAIRRKTNVILKYKLPGKENKSGHTAEFLEARKRGLREYLMGITEQQSQFLCNDNYEQILIHFFAPTQIGDNRLGTTTLPFEIKV